MAIPCGIMVPASWLLVKETPVAGAKTICPRCCRGAGQGGTASLTGLGATASGQQQAATRLTLKDYRDQCWKLLKTKAMFYIVLYSFFSAAVGSITTTAQGNVQKYWAGVKNLQNQIFSMVGLGLFAIGLWVVKKYFLNRSWRAMLLWTTVALNLVDAFFVFLTVFGVVRNQYVCGVGGIGGRRVEKRRENARHSTLAKRQSEKRGRETGEK